MKIGPFTSATEMFVALFCAAFCYPLAFAITLGLNGAPPLIMVVTGVALGTAATAAVFFPLREMMRGR